MSDSYVPDPPELAQANAVATTVPPQLPNFDRPVVAILGLPFDSISLADAVERIRSDSFSGRRCFLSTSNLHFAIASRSDPEFRHTVLASDLNLIDGMPLVWTARLLGLPALERVAGSDLFDALQAHAGPPVNVYLFGGPQGAAQAACLNINQRGGGLHCVGYDAAGFGSVDSMSTEDCIQRINGSGAHFVIASLGAKKGQAWLQRNAPRLVAPVLSHLGAVVNFTAGNVRRAPPWTRSLGLEWLWRIKEEPELWRRYLDDGMGALGLLTRLIPDMWASRVANAGRGVPGTAKLHRNDENDVTIGLAGSWKDPDCAPLRKALAACAKERVARLCIDLSEVTHVGNTIVAICLLARGTSNGQRSVEFVGANAAVSAAFRRKMADHLLVAAH